MARLSPAAQEFEAGKARARLMDGPLRRFCLLSKTPRWGGHPRHQVIIVNRLLPHR